MRTIAKYEQQHGTVRRIDQQSQLFECESESVIQNLRNGTINCNRDVDEPEKESFLFLLFVIFGFRSTHVNRPLINYETDMNKQYVEYVRASETRRGKKAKENEQKLRELIFAIAVV